MSGHSKWASIKRKKTKTDAQRGRLFTKLIKEISVAARQGGGDPEGNPRLKSAILHAKSSNMPNENIERAIKKGTGELPGVSFEEVQYEGYGPGGIAILTEVVTDNKNRTTAEIRHIFTKHGGNLGTTGCVSWMFKTKAVVIVDRKKCDEDTLLALALDSGADDVRSDEVSFEIVGPIDRFESIKNSLKENSIEFEDAEITKLPQNLIRLEGKKAEQVLKLVETLEENDDVQHVYANFDISEDVMTKIAV